MEKDRGYTRLGVDHYDKKGKPVYGFRCHICGGKYKNYNNANAHVAACRRHQENAIHQRAFPILKALGITPDQLPLEAVLPPQVKPHPEPGASLSHEHQALVELIADLNIPYTQIEAPSWVNFVHALNPGVKLPKKDTLRRMIIEHANTLLDESLNDCTGMTCGVAVDGATIFGDHTYAFILIHPHGLRLAGIHIVDDQRGATLAQTTAEVLNVCIQHDIHISGVVSDNARSLVSALTNMNPKDPLSLRVLIGMAVLRCACAAHTSQLAINDVIKTNAILEKFFADITSLLHWIGKRVDNFKKVCPLKIPRYIATRWNTLASCGQFIIDNHEKIDAFISSRLEIEAAEYQTALEQFNKGIRKTEPDEPILPPVITVPSIWAKHVAALNVIATFTDSIEGDLQLQQQVYVSVIETESSLQRMQSEGNEVAKALLTAFRTRFITTADLTLAQLAYIFTPNGLNAHQALPNSIAKRTTQSKLKKKFLSIAASLNLHAMGPEGIFLPAIFDNFIKFACIDDGEDPYVYWEQKIDESITLPQVNGGNPISLSIFSTIALIMISLPASEAMVERAFSQLKAISTDFNKSMETDLFLSLSTIKLCTRYKNKYSFKIMKR